MLVNIFIIFPFTDLKILDVSVNTLTPITKKLARLAKNVLVRSLIHHGVVVVS